MTVIYWLIIVYSSPGSGAGIESVPIGTRSVCEEHAKRIDAAQYYQAFCVKGVR